ncbi:MAG: rubredoxin-like domain-containing protein, partial [Chloroflexota bacterium]
MSEQTVGAWQCTVCGYVHRGPTPPDWCPICGAAAEEFEPYLDVEPVAAAAEPARTEWRCLVCDHRHEGRRPPAECPVCGAAADEFEPVAEAPAVVAAPGGAGKVLIVGAGIAGLAAAEAAR